MQVTVFTPSFNRSHTLPRVYKSLLAQTNKDFEWIIVDDGSTDNTVDLVNKWQSENLLDICFVRQTNKGKFTTLIETIERAKGEWFLIADSDDEFEANTIDVFLNTYSRIPQDVRNQVSGVSCLVKDSSTGRVVGDLYPIPEGEAYLISDVNEISFKFGIKGEKWGILKTSVLKEFVGNLPDFENSKYIGENILWIPIASKYKTVFINVPLRIYFQGTSGTLSSRNIAGRYPLGAWITERTILPYTSKYFLKQPIAILKSVIKLNYAAIAAGKSLSKTIKGYKPFLKALVFVTRPLAYLVLLKFPINDRGLRI